MKFYHIFLALSLLSFQEIVHAQQRSFDSSIPADSLSPKKEDRIKVYLDITPFVPMEIVDTKGRKYYETRPAQTNRFILNAAIKKEKHFFVSGDYHLVLRPNPRKALQALAFDVSVFKKIAGQQQVEEMIGDINVEGEMELISENPKVYRFKGSSEKVFLDQWGKEILQVRVGASKNSPVQAVNKSRGQSASY